ncbi:MAG: hypothetical protein AAB176_00720 [Pseudomonadota bacterium]
MKSSAQEPARPDAMPAESRGPDCWKCAYLNITYLRATPYSCQFMGFKSKWLPSLEVLRADGEYCRGFMPKAIKPVRPVVNIKA